MSTPDANNQTDPGLPPVDPPSGRFILQLFLIPALIVSVLVFIVWLGSSLVAERRSADYFLQNLDSDNPDVRWRAANDLAQVLQRPESKDLQTDVVFALDLSERLHTEWSNLVKQEQAILKNEELTSEDEKKKEIRKLSKKRDYIQFLIASVSSFLTPVGAPVLCEIAVAPPKGYFKGEVLRRRSAVWSLANMGAKVKEFSKLDSESKKTILESLEEEAKGTDQRSKWAKSALDFLKDGKALPVTAALDQCTLKKNSFAEDIYLRSLVALALNFWQGPEVSATLERLANDDGWGQLIKVNANEE